MSATLAILTLLAAAPALEASLQRAVTREGARVELTKWEAPACQGQLLPAPFDASGRVPVRVRGARCDAWGWASVRVYVNAVTLTREVKVNQPVDGAWVVSEVEARGEQLATLPAGTTAARWLKKGQVVSPADVRTGPKPGTPVTVKVLLGGLSVEQRGTISPCAPHETCATLPSGKKVSGVFVDGTLLVGGGS